MEAQMKINGEAVRALREQKSWSQEHLANASGLSVRTVQRVEMENVASAETRGPRRSGGCPDVSASGDRRTGSEEGLRRRNAQDTSWTRSRSRGRRNTCRRVQRTQRLY